jgi:hypothetical protein
MDSLDASESRPLQAALADSPIPGSYENVEDEEGKHRMLGKMPTVSLQDNLGPRFQGHIP